MIQDTKQQAIPARRQGERVKYIAGGRALSGSVEWSDGEWVGVTPDDGDLWGVCSDRDVFNEVGDLKLADRLRAMASELVDAAIRIEDEHRERGT